MEAVGTNQCYSQENLLQGFAKVIEHSIQCEERILEIYQTQVNRLTSKLFFDISLD